MEKHISIQIPKPCHENWKAMTPDDKGRFCNSCSKIVVDFTMMSNTEIIRYFETASKGSTCGRFSVSQVDTPLFPEPVVTIPPYRYAWLTPFRKLAAMLVTGITLLLASCNRKPGTTTGEIAVPPTVQPARPDTAETNVTDTPHVQQVHPGTKMERCLHQGLK